MPANFCTGKETRLTASDVCMTCSLLVPSRHERLAGIAKEVQCCFLALLAPADLAQADCWWLQDAKVVDNACLALSRIAEAFAHRPANLNMLCEHGLITNALQLVRSPPCFSFAA